MRRIINQVKIESNNIEKIYNELLEIYISKGFELEEETNNYFQLQNTLYSNKNAINSMIINSNESKELEKIIKNYTFSDFKIFVYSEHLFYKDTKLIKKIIELYELTEQLISLEEKYIFNMSHNLNKIIGNNIVSNKKQELISDEDGNLVLKEIPKTLEEINRDYKVALEKAEELYINEGLLDRSVYIELRTMINNLFNRYVIGNKKLPIDEYRTLNEINNLDKKNRRK